MLKDLVFKKVDDKFVSDPVQLQGDASVYLEFAPELGKGTVRLQQSTANREFFPFHRNFEVKDIFDTVINGVIPGMYVRVVCDFKPTFAQILIPDE